MGRLRIRSLVRLLSVLALVFVAVPAQTASAAAGLGLLGRLSVHTGGFDINSIVRSYNLATGEEFLPSFNPVPQPANGRSVAFDAQGNVLTTALNPGLGDFNGDGKIHKFTRTGVELGFINVQGGLNFGALDFDKDENAIWGAVYRPNLGLAKLAKVDPATGAILADCDIPFVPTGGAGNDTLAVAKIGGVKVLLTDAADGNLASTTLFAVKVSACQAGALISIPGPDVTSYLLKRGGADVPRVTGAAVDPGTGSLLVASIAGDENSTTILNLGPAPFQNATGPALDPPISGLVYDLAIDTSLLDDFNRADGVRFGSNLGPNWTGATDGGYYRIFSNGLRNFNAGYIYWNAATFGPNQETAITFRQISTTADEQDLNLKINGIAPDGQTGGANFSLIQIQYNATTQKVLINSAVPVLPPSNPNYRPQWVLHHTFALTLVNGDTLGAQALSDGTVKVLKNGVVVKTINISIKDPVTNPYPFPAALSAGGGKVGLWVHGATSTNPSIMDNFRGATLNP